MLAVLVADVVFLQHNFEKQLLRVRFSCDGCYAVAGSSDRNVCIWDLETIPSKEQGGDATRNLVYRLPGHTGSVNDVSTVLGKIGVMMFMRMLFFFVLGVAAVACCLCRM